MKKRKKSSAPEAVVPESNADAVENKHMVEKREMAAVDRNDLLPEAVPTPTAEDEPSDRAYRAAAVAFFTRSKSGQVDKVLVALEERKVQASLLGLDQKGKVSVDMIVFPMGRREKKDKNDCVETAKREYIEETTNFSGLAKYLDFADFTGDAAELEGRGADEWTGKNNLALFFAPAAMVVVFCEVPLSARTAPSLTPATPDLVHHVDNDSEGTGKKKRKKGGDEGIHKPSPNYHIGRKDHLQPFWLDASELRKIAESTDKAPMLHVQDKDCRFFPTNASALRLPEARAFFGLPPKAADASLKSKTSK